MPKHGKKYNAAAAQTSEVARSAEDAVALVKKIAPAKFDETVEISMNLGVDRRRPTTRRTADSRGRSPPARDWQSDPRDGVCGR